MSAREEIHRLFESGRTSYRLDELLDSLGTEVLREAAAEIRAKAHDLYGDEERWASEAYGLLDAADLIDPDKENSADADPHLHP